MLKFMALFALILTLTTSSIEAFCEHGTKINSEYVGGGQLVTYDFGQGRLLKFKFPSGASIPFSIRFDFYKWELCY